MYSIMGTGPRSLVVEPKAKRVYAMGVTENRILQIREERGEILVISGMAEGWDEMLAKIAIRNNIPFDAYVPHPTYGEYYWGRNSKMKRNRLTSFNELLSKARKVHYSSAGELYINGTHVNFIRNSHMVAACDMGLVYNPKSSGTRDAVAKLTQARKPFEVFPFTEQLQLL